MRIVSENIKNALKEKTTQRKGRILVNDNYYEVYNVNYYADCYVDGNVIGNAVASQLDFDIPYMEKFNTFKYYDGVWTGTNYEYIDIGTFHVFDEQDEDEFNKHITAFDNLIKFNAPFQDVGGYPKTLLQELSNICNQAGVKLKNTNIVNGNFQVISNQFTSGENLKAVLKAICQLSGTYAVIKNDELELMLVNKTDEKLEKKHHEPITWKRRTYGINQVILGMADVEGEYAIREDLNDIAINGVHKLVINDNPFAFTQEKRQQLIDGLFEQVKGFGYLPYEMKTEWLNYLEIGDTIIIDDIETIVLRIDARTPKSLETTISAPAIIDSAVEYVNNTEIIEKQFQRTEISVDKQNQIIQSVAEQTTEQNQKIAQVTQTVEELNSKISDVADITISKDSIIGEVEFEDINESEPIRIVVRPIGENISYLYPNNNLFPSNTTYLKIRKIRFENVKTNEVVDYQLPTDLLYYNSENYDEFILDYDGQSCVVNKRVGYNADGTTYVLTSPTTIEYEYPRILLTDGDYKITIPGYTTAYLFVRLMSQNIYTTQFATKAEVTSEINQTASTINLRVDQKLDGKDFTGANIMLEINKDESLAQINADKISLSGKDINLTSDNINIESESFSISREGIINGTAGIIGGWNIEKTSLWCYITPPYDYKESDLTRIQNIIIGSIAPTQQDIQKYDINGDGVIDALDLNLCNKFILYNFNNSNPGKLILDTLDWFKPIKIVNSYGEILSYFGVNGVWKKDI